MTLSCSFRMPRTAAPAGLTLALAAAVLLGACSGRTTGLPAAGVKVVTPAEAQRVIEAGGDRLVVLDVRTPEEFAAGHLSGAMMIDFRASGFPERIRALDRGRQYVVYCRTGHRSGETRALMKELGFTEVYDIEGGITAWKDAGLPVTTA